MMNGTDQLAIINQHMAKARDDLDTIYKRMETVNQRFGQITEPVGR